MSKPTTYNLSLGKNSWRATRKIMEKAVTELGGTMAQIADAMECRGDVCKLNTKHDAWRSLVEPLLPKKPKTVDKSGGPERWADLFCRSGYEIKDKRAEVKFVAELADGLEKSCSCNSKWMRYIASNPPTIDSIDSYTRWAWKAQNDKRIELGKEPMSLHDAIAGRPLAMHLKDCGGGIGDCVVAYYAACRLANQSKKRVVFYARNPEWLCRVSHPLVTIRSQHDIGVNASGGWDGPNGYNDATQNAASRLHAYCANLGVSYGIEPFNIDRTLKTQRDGRYAVIAPFTSRWVAREWPEQKWQELCRVLADNGIKPIGVGQWDQRDRLAQILGDINGAEWFYGQPAEFVCDLMLGSEVVIGNDSGICHVAGMLNVPAVCVHAGSLPHEYLFGQCESVVSVTAEGTQRADANSYELRKISVDDVRAAVRTKLKK